MNWDKLAARIFIEYGPNQRGPQDYEGLEWSFDHSYFYEVRILGELIRRGKLSHKLRLATQQEDKKAIADRKGSAYTEHTLQLCRFVRRIYSRPFDELNLSNELDIQFQRRDNGIVTGSITEYAVPMIFDTKVTAD